MNKRASASLSSSEAGTLERLKAVETLALFLHTTAASVVLLPLLPAAQTLTWLKESLVSGSEACKNFFTAASKTEQRDVTEDHIYMIELL